MALRSPHRVPTTNMLLQIGKLYCIDESDTDEDNKDESSSLDLNEMFEHQDMISCFDCNESDTENSDFNLSSQRLGSSCNSLNASDSASSNSGGFDVDDFMWLVDKADDFVQDHGKTEPLPRYDIEPQLSYLANRFVNQYHQLLLLRKTNSFLMAQLNQMILHERFAEKKESRWRED